MVLAPTTAPARLTGIIEQARTDPKSFSFGTYGYGTAAHLLLLELNKSQRLDLAHIPYKGTAPLVQALLAGDVKLGVSNYATARPFIESGKLRAIAVYGTSRSPFMPDVPTLKESGVAGFEWSQWIGMFAASRTPTDVVQRIAQDMSAVLKSEPVVKRLAEMFTLPGTKVTQEFGSVVERNAKEQGGMSQAFGIRMGE